MRIAKIVTISSGHISSWCSRSMELRESSSQSSEQARAREFFGPSRMTARYTSGAWQSSMTLGFCGSLLFSTFDAGIIVRSPTQTSSSFEMEKCAATVLFRSTRRPLALASRNSCGIVRAAPGSP